MKKHFQLPDYLDAPEKPLLCISFVYAFLAFFAVPVLFFYLLAGWQNTYWLTWFEFAYHLLNCIIALSYFRSYIRSGLFYFSLDLKESFFVVKMALLSIAAIVAIVYVASNLCDLPWLFTAMLRAFPMTELEVWFLGGDLTYYNPVSSFLCTVVIAPVTICCLLYCVSFVPAFQVRPWLSYLAVAAWVAFTHLRNAITPWDLSTELILYAIQLPVHLIACRAFHKTNSICTPMIILAITNLLAWVYMVVQLLMR